MASVVTRKNGTREIRFLDGNSARRTVRLGRVPKKAAETVRIRIEQLVWFKESGTSPDPELGRWLGTIEDWLHERLARAGLVDARIPADLKTLGAWLDCYIGERRDVKSSTRETYMKARDNLIDYFGADHPLREITPADAKRWRIWLATEGNRRDTKKKRKDMADETVRRRTGKAKQFFAGAVERGLIDANPFAKLPSTTRGNDQRQFFVETAWVDKCIEHAPCGDWKVILALCRYGGLRCPSEVLGLRWVDVNLAEGRMTIRAPKTEHHAAGGIRQCPIFPELRPYLESARNVAPEGTEFVVNRYRDAEQNLRTQLIRIIGRAGLEPWPRLFQNLRASRETELMGTYPAKDVAAWLGNSVPVAMRHYAMPREETFERAIRQGAGAQGAPESAPVKGGQSFAEVANDEAEKKPSEMLGHGLLWRRVTTP